MMVKWTDEQAKAVYGEKANCLVSAAAGSGKTQVLTGRIIHRILNENIDVNRILIVTFTKAAAAEMRSRITEGLEDALSSDPGNRHLQRQLSLISSADITTMDSFCLKLLRNHFIEAGLDAGFRVIEGTESKLMRAEAAAEALEEMYRLNDPDFISFSNCYSSAKDDTVLCDLAIELYEFAESMPDPQEWIREKAALYSVSSPEEYESGAISRTILEGVCRELEAMAAHCNELISEFSDSYAYVEVFEKDRNALLDIIRKADSWNALKDAIDAFKWPRREKKEENKGLAEVAESERSKLKKYTKAVFDKIQFDAEMCVYIMGLACPHIKALCKLTEVFSRFYTEAKKEKNILDYGDLEHLAISLLSEKTKDGMIPSPLACSLRDVYDEIYIDEYQDSNDVQELLFTLLSGESIGKPNMFMVGDMKQSIYGFRKTSPELFIQKNETYEDEGANRKVSLTKNFRSRAEILDFINFVFEKSMHKSVGGITYTDKERLNPGAPYPESKEARIEIAVANTEGNAEQRLEDEAKLIVKKIQEAMQTEVYDLKKSIYRPTQYSDITVIMRSAKDMASPLQKACDNAGIPLYCDVGGGFFSSTEVSVFLALLQCIDNPMNDIPLLATLRAPFFTFSEDELAQIRLRDRKNLFYHAVLQTAKEESYLGKKCCSFLKKLRRWRRKASFVPTDTLILTLFEETGYLLFLDGCPGGEKKRANLELLFDKAHKFEQTSFRGLFHFLQYIERVSEKEDKESEAKLVSEAQNVVRLMSIHKSKGLEFPIVILAGTGKQFNKKSVQGSFLMHKDLGIGISCVEERRRIRFETPVRTAVFFQKSAEERGEELRVLYVALTRAKERLIITGATDKNVFLKKQLGDISPAGVMHAENPLILLGCCAALKGDVPIRFYDMNEEISEKEHAHKLFTPLKPDRIVADTLGYQYPNPELKNLPSKISVTEYKRLKEEHDEITFPLYKSTSLKKPRFCNINGNVKGANFGSLMHFVMQNFPYQSVRSYSEIQNYIDGLEKKKILSEEQATAINIDMLHNFWNGEMGERIRKAEKVYREMPFTQTVPASLLTNDSRHMEDKVVIQGVIDCFFFENNKIVLLDYKTDAPAPAKVLEERYRTQLECYAMALRQKFFSEIYQKVIYLFANNGIIIVK